MEKTWKHFAATGRVEDYLKYKEKELRYKESSGSDYQMAQKIDLGVTGTDGNKPNRDGAGY